MKTIALAAFAATSVLFTGTAGAQQGDFSNAEIKAIDLGHNTYLVEGQGGNTLAVGTDGIIQVDSQLAPLH